MQPPFISIYVLLTFIFINMSALSQSSDTLLYRKTPDYLKKFTSGGISSRFMDGLGFMFYWATEGLRIEDLNYTIDLRNGDTLPFWFFVNEQISDCIWHCGQISSFRRITGNPLNSNVSMFEGTDNN